MPFDGVSGDPILAILLAGRTKIIEKGWCQGSASDVHGRVCAGYAINMFSTEIRSIDEIRAANYLENAIPAFSLATLVRCVSSYNDLPTTTHADILALYDRAIAARMAEVYHAV